MPILPAMIVAFITGTPVSGILALGGIMFFLISGDAPLAVIPSALQYGVASFVLLAVPFFMVAGIMMEITGMARRMVDMVQEWVGHLTGGLLMAEVLATYLFSGVSGSKAADVATIGTVMKGPMKEHGYPSTEFVAVLAASAAMAETVPPSVAMLILGSVIDACRSARCSSPGSCRPRSSRSRCSSASSFEATSRSIGEVRPSISAGRCAASRPHCRRPVCRSW